MTKSASKDGKAIDAWLEALCVVPGEPASLGKRNPGSKPPGLSRKTATDETQAAIADIDRLQYLLYADAGSSLLIVLQGLDAAGKDGTIRHVMSGMNPQGVKVAAFKQPTPQEAAHDFLWRVHRHAPGKGEVGIFNRSHYEDVLVTRVHELVPETVWRPRYQQINAFEAQLVSNGTRILKFFLHISPEEQLDRFAQRLNDPARQWKISEADYTERTFWKHYVAAYEDSIGRTSTDVAAWYVIPADHKWVRNFAVSRIIANTLDAMGLRTPPTRVDLEDIRRRYHKAVEATR